MELKMTPEDMVCCFLIRKVPNLPDGTEDDRNGTKLPFIDMLDFIALHFVSQWDEAHHEPINMVEIKLLFAEILINMGRKIRQPITAENLRVAMLERQPPRDDFERQSFEYLYNTCKKFLIDDYSFYEIQVK